MCVELGQSVEAGMNGKIEVTNDHDDVTGRAGWGIIISNIMAVYLGMSKIHGQLLYN